MLVEVAAYAINRGELALIERRPDGWAPGQDVAGVVAVAAADGTGPARRARLEGFFIYRTGEETFGHDLAALAELVADGRLEPQIGSVRDWAGTSASLTALRGREVTGKLVLTRG